MEYFSFESLDAFKHSRKLVSYIYFITKKFPKSESFGLTNQIQRAAVSIASNIAEGSGRYSAKEKIHFIEIAYGSLMEVYCQSLLAFDLNYIEENELINIKDYTQNISRALSGLKKYFISLDNSSIK